MVLQAALSLGDEGVPFEAVLAVLQVSAAIGLSSPVANQPNLMVAYEGGYRFSDYVFCGLPLQLALVLLTVWWSLLLF